MKKALFSILALGIALVAFAGCKGPTIKPAPDHSSAIVEVSGIDDCIIKIRVTISQAPAPTETQDITLSGGSGSVVFRRRFNWDAPVNFTASVLEVKRDERCGGFRDLLLSYSGVLIPRLNDTYEVPPELIASYKSQTVAGPPTDGGASTLVTVFGGKTRERFKTDAGNQDQDRLILWARPDGCRETCWEQWANYSVEWVHNDGPPRTSDPLFTGASDRYPQGARRLHFRRFERDLPDGPGLPGSPRENCFREDPIPNVDGVRGVSDMPNQTARNPTDAAIRAFQRKAAIELLGLPNGPTPPAPRPFDLHMHFEMRSLLFCLNPARALLGYYQWSADENLHFSDSSATATYDPPTYRLSDPTWTPGATGLQSPPIVTH